jgi:uncharacterized delta-60 repeat protein
MAGISRTKHKRRRTVFAEVLETRRLLSTGTITGTVFNDQNNNQVQDSGEAGIPNIEVYVSNASSGQFQAGDQFTITNGAGAYTISNVPAGSYFVRQIVPKTAIQTLPVNYLQTTTVAASQIVTLNFGQYVLNTNTSLAALSMSTLNGSSATATQPDGKVIVVGQDSGGGYPNDSFLARYFPDGTIDKTFGTGYGTLFKNFGGVYSTLTSVSVQPNGDVVVAGEYYDNTNSLDVDEGYVETWSITGQQIGLLQYTPTTNAAFYNGSICTSVVPFGAGQALVGGVTPAGELFLEAIDLSTGQPETSFGTQGFEVLDEPDPVSGSVSVAISPLDGSIWAATTTISGSGYDSTDFAIAHFDTSGNPLISDGFTEQSVDGFDASVNALVVQPDGEPVVAGYVDTTPEQFALIRFSTAGFMDTSFGGDGGTSGIEMQEFGSNGATDAQAQSVQVNADGSLLVHGLAAFNGSYSTVASVYPSSGPLPGTEMATGSNANISALNSTLPSNTYITQLQQPTQLYNTSYTVPIIQVAFPTTQIGRLSQPLPTFPTVSPAGTAPGDPGITPALVPATLPDLTTLNTVSYTFNVQYQDSVYGINPSTLGLENLNVSGTSLTNAPAAFTGIMNSSATSVTAQYSVSLPSDQVWSSVNNGQYTIWLNPDQVASLSRASTSSSIKLGTFNVSEPITTTGSITGLVTLAGAPEAGVTVSLLTQTNAATGITSATNSSGGYLFTGVESGYYSVAETVPAGSSGGPVGSALVTVGAGAVAGPTFANEPLTAVGSIAGSVLVLGSNDPLANVTVLLKTITNGVLENGSTSVVTSAAGSYAFNGLAAGTYDVAVVTPEGDTLISAGSANVSVGTTAVSGPIFILTGDTGSITGTVSNATANTPLPGVTVTLTNSSSGVLSTTTDSNGNYSFDNLAPDTYTVAQDTPAYYVAKAVTGSTTVTVGTTAATGPVFSDALIGGTISGAVTNVLSGLPLQGVTVFIDANANGQLDTGEVSTVTNSQGQYLFTGLSAGSYFIGEVLPALTVDTYTGSTQVIVGSATGAIGPAFTDEPASGAIEGNVINGLTDLPESGILVYLDTNNNGMLDTGETVITTDSTGSYQFTGLLPGTYHVAAVSSGGNVVSGIGALAVGSVPLAGPTLLVTPSVVSTGPDLAVSIVSATPVSVVGGTVGSVTLSISNLGATTATGRKVTYTLFLSPGAGLSAGDTAAYTVQRPLSLRSGRSGKVKLAFKYPKTLANGSYYLVASVYGTAYFAETDYFNNTPASANPIQIAQPVITLSGTVVNPALTTIAVNRTGWLYVDVVNNGNVLANGVITVGLYADVNPALDSSSISLGSVREAVVLNPGKSRVYRLLVKAPLSIAAGEYYLIADLNQKGTINDSDPATEVVISPNPTQLG